MDVGIRSIGAPTERVELASLGVRDAARRLVSHLFRIGARPVARAGGRNPCAMSTLSAHDVCRTKMA